MQRQRLSLSHAVSLRETLRETRISDRMPRMDPHERATSVWYRIAGLITRKQKDQAVSIIAAEIRSAQKEVLLDASDRVSDPTAKKLLHELARRANPLPK